MSPEYMEEEVPDPSELYLLVTNPNIQTSNQPNRRSGTGHFLRLRSIRSLRVLVDLLQWCHGVTLW